MEEVNGEEYTILQLRDWLRHINLPMSGNKAALVLRLNAVPADQRGVCPDTNNDDVDLGDDTSGANGDANDDVEANEEENASNVQQGVNRELELLKKELALAEREKRLLKMENELLKRENSGQVSTPSLQGTNGISITTLKDFLPEYDGTGSVELWIAQLENLGRQFALQDETMKALIMCNVRDNAKVWLHSKSNYMSSDINTLFGEMRSAFKSPTSKLAQRRQFESRKWLQGEGFAKYFNEKMRMSAGLHFEETELVEHLIEGINNYQLRTQATIQCFTRPDDLLKAFSKIELPKIQKLTLNNNTTASSSTKSGIRCYNCNSLGHYANDCKKPKRALGTCYGCGSPDHIVTTCPQRKGVHVIDDTQEAP